MTRITDLSLANERLWGAAEIARFLGLSQDAVYRLADDPDVPIYRPPGSGRLFALKTELMGWLRSKSPKNPEKP